MGAQGGRYLPARSKTSAKARIALLSAVLLIVLLIALLMLLWSGVSLTGSRSALARMSVQPLGGTLQSARAFAPDGHEIPVSVVNGRITPLRSVTPGEVVRIEVVVKRPGWEAWLIGARKREQLSVRAPVAQVSSEWITVPAGASPTVHFQAAVASVSYGADHVIRRLARPAAVVSLGVQPAAGSTTIRVAARSWERLGKPTLISWFPASPTTVVIARPSVGSNIAPSTPLKLMFSKPVSQALGGRMPTLSPRISGRWQRLNSHTLMFTPSGLGAPLGSRVQVNLPGSFGVPDPPKGGASGGASSAAGQIRQTRSLQWTVPAGSILRVQQLLAEQGYMPLTWSPSGKPVAHTDAAEVRAAVEPPAGHFSWRYANTPASLQHLWSEGEPNTITKGALMMFQNDNGMEATGLAEPATWRALIADAIAGKRHSGGYSYVYVHREVPETATLWHDGRVILSTPANTGVPGAETELGSFAVFEHIPEGTMEGTNPNGTHYRDEGIKWISYFNGGDALHYFPRASYGFPQSVGCVEMPLQAAAEVWPYTPIGTLVTVEG